MTVFSLIKIPEIGLEVRMPAEWSIDYDAKEDIIFIGNRERQIGLIITRDAHDDIKALDKILEIIGLTGCDKVKLDYVSDRELLCRDVKGEVNVRILKIQGALIMTYHNIRDKESSRLLREVIESIRLSKPLHGLYESRKRVNEENYRWSITLPITWSVKPYGLFNNGFMAKVGNTIVWMTFYPLFDLSSINQSLERRAELILNEIWGSKQIKREINSNLISIEFNKVSINYELTIRLSIFPIDINGSIESIVVESGFITPKFLKNLMEPVINEILLSYSFGPNFMHDLQKLGKQSYCLFSIAILSRFIGKNVNEIFDKYFQAIDSEIIDALSLEIKSLYG